MNKRLINILVAFITLPIIITLIFGTIYATSQQVLRQSANDPQIQMAQDTASALESGKEAHSLIPSSEVDISKSLAPYIIIYDKDGQAMESSAVLDGKIPVVPKGVFDYVRSSGEDRFTWEPKDGVRSAVVVTSYKGVNSGFVLAGRSLREIEIRENKIMLIAGIGWVITIGVSLVSIFLKNKLER